jgi:signal transduction histidine kinase
MPKWVGAPRLRPERVIAAARVVLAAFSLFAVWLDPTEPVNYAQVAYGLLVAYVIYSGAVVALLWRAEAVAPWWPLVTHVGDLVFFSLFIFFTAGPASPFTVYFVFALMCATLRWQLRGTFWTAVVTLGAFFSLGIYFGLVQGNPDFDVRAFIIRGVYMIVLAVLLGYVGAHDQRVLRELRLLASWPPTGSRDVESLARELLAYAGHLLEVPRVLLAWTEQDAPWHRVAVWTRGAWEHQRLEASVPVVARTIRDLAFIHNAGYGGRTLVREDDLPRLVVWTGDSIDRAFAEQFAISSALSIPIHGESFDGRLFFLDKADATLDDLMLSEIAAGMLAARFDAFYMTEQLRQTAATEERIRLARDLHDGVLQSFTGIALKMAAARRIMQTDSAGATAALEDVQQILASAQRDLRFFIEDLKPNLLPVEKSKALDARLAELARRMEREWDLRVRLQLEVDLDQLTSSMCWELYHLVREALINAARHGAASAAHVRLVPSEAGIIAISIADNGHGFAFSGRYTGDELATLELGPKTLRERVTAMHGSLTLESGPSGSELHITLPIAA